MTSCHRGFVDNRRRFGLGVEERPFRAAFFDPE